MQETNLKEKITKSFFSHTYTTMASQSIQLNEPEEYRTWLLSPKEMNINIYEQEVGIFLQKEIGKQVYKKIEFKRYELSLLLSFKGKYKIQLISIYNSPNSLHNTELKSKIRKWLIEILRKAKQKNYYTIIGGDWNATIYSN